MTSVTQTLADKKLITPPPFVPGSIQYEVLMGSEAYGVSSDQSDRDIYGFCIPPKSTVFPHTAGEIDGFGRQKKRFQQYQQHHVYSAEARSGRGCEYDLAIYNIVRYFHLCMDNNPNMIDSLFVPNRCVLFITKIGTMVREQRHIFLHKGAWFKLKGYAFSQVKKMCNKNPDPTSKRYAEIQKFGLDCKFAYHVVRLLNEAEEILTEGNLTLDRNREQLKAIRAGEWTLEQVKAYFDSKERELEGLYTASTLQHSPDEGKIKALLLACLEEYYGSLDAIIAVPNAEQQVLREIARAAEKVRHRL